MLLASSVINFPITELHTYDRLLSFITIKFTFSGYKDLKVRREIVLAIGQSAIVCLSLSISEYLSPLYKEDWTGSDAPLEFQCWLNGHLP